MLRLKTISTGSIGNCYLLSTDAETLILDCGVPIMDIKKGLNFDLSKVVGCVVSHAHHDHDKSANDLNNMGIRVWQPYKHEVEMQRVQRRYYGEYMIRNFVLPHNEEPCCGFMIECENGEKVLYMTDFEYCKYNFQHLKLNHILVECNYQQELVNRDLPNYEHKIRGHCSLQTCKDFVQANATDSLRTVLLLHMGGETCNPMECVTEIQKAVKSSVYVDYARKGLEVELRTDECPF